MGQLVFPLIKGSATSWQESRARHAALNSAPAVPSSPSSANHDQVWTNSGSLRGSGSDDVLGPPGARWDRDLPSHARDTDAVSGQGVRLVEKPFPLFARSQARKLAAFRWLKGAAA